MKGFIKKYSEPMVIVEMSGERVTIQLPNGREKDVPMSDLIGLEGKVTFDQFGAKITDWTDQKNVPAYNTNAVSEELDDVFKTQAENVNPEA